MYNESDSLTSIHKTTPLGYLPLKSIKQSVSMTSIEQKIRDEHQHV